MAKLRISKSVLLKALFIPPVVAGVLISVYMVNSRAEPERHPVVERAIPVRTYEVVSMDVVPRALGYGSAEPGKVWRAVSEVSGEAVHVAAELRRGTLVPEGLLLVEIDPSRYELAKSEAEASMLETEARINELAGEESNTKTLLALEKRALELAEDQLGRQRELAKTGRASQTVVDQEELNVLTQRAKVQAHENSLALIPSRKKALEATLALYRAKMASAELDLASTKIEAPFACRISSASVEARQFVTAGQTLFEADSIATTEVTAQVQLAHMRLLIAEQDRKPLFERKDFDVSKIIDLEAKVRLRDAGMTVEWDARFARISDVIDTQTRTVGVVVIVDQAYSNVGKGSNPPLVKGMYVEVELRAPARKAQRVVPRIALHANEVYVVDQEQRLRMRKVVVQFALMDFAVVEGLEPGEVVVVSDPVPAVDGMLLAPTVDAEFTKHIASQARGEGTIK